MFEPHFALDKARPAPYNPRRIDELNAADLRASLRELGVLKAVVVAGDGLVLAGHQRSAQLRAIGETTCPVVVLDSVVGFSDQARFNQLHNGCDLDFAAPGLWISDDLSAGWHLVNPARVEGDCSGFASEKREICELLARYGPWGNSIATDGGDIVVGGLYAACCALLGLPLLICVVGAQKADAIRARFGRNYGEFSYEPIARSTWVQSLAQMHRLRGPKIKSRTYENLVIPRLFPGARVLDFGAGQMDYVRALQGQGVDIRGVEFYRRKGNSIDVDAVQRDISALCADLRAGGLFDIVVCDSVLNSVDSQDAENDVLTCLNAFCKPDGIVIWSGRNRHDQRLISDAKKRKRTGKTSTLGFFDENGLTAMPRGNAWQFQKFHAIADVATQAGQFFGDDWAIFNNDGRLISSPQKSGHSDRPAWGAVATKSRILSQSQVEAALSREFDLPLPDGSTFERGADIVNAWKVAQTSFPTTNYES